MYVIDGLIRVAKYILQAAFSSLSSVKISDGTFFLPAEYGRLRHCQELQLLSDLQDQPR